MNGCVENPTLRIARRARRVQLGRAPPIASEALRGATARPGHARAEARALRPGESRPGPGPRRGPHPELAPARGCLSTPVG